MKFNPGDKIAIKDQPKNPAYYDGKADGDHHYYGRNGRNGKRVGTIHGDQILPWDVANPTPVVRISLDLKELARLTGEPGYKLKEEMLRAVFQEARDPALNAGEHSPKKAEISATEATEATEAAEAALKIQSWGPGLRGIASAPMGSYHDLQDTKPTNTRHAFINLAYGEEVRPDSKWTLRAGAWTVDLSGTATEAEAREYVVTGNLPGKSAETGKSLRIQLTRGKTTVMVQDDKDVVEFHLIVGRVAHRQSYTSAGRWNCRPNHGASDVLFACTEEQAREYVATGNLPKIHT